MIVAHPGNALLPRPTELSLVFWNGLAQKQVRIQRCADCNKWVFYPRCRCNACLSDRLVWQTVSGCGQLYSFTVNREQQTFSPPGRVSPILAVVELDEGVRMTSVLVNVDEAEVEIGMALIPFFDRIDDRLTLLKFQPARRP